MALVEQIIFQLNAYDHAAFRNYLDKKEYARVGIYLDFVTRMVNDPAVVTTEAFRREVKYARLNSKNEEEDIQAIAFYCWLTSNMFNRDFYSVLLDAINWKSNFSINLPGTV